MNISIRQIPHTLTDTSIIQNDDLEIQVDSHA